MKATLANKLMLLLKISLFSCLLFISHNAFAEYYMVYTPWRGDQCHHARFVYHYRCDYSCYYPNPNYVYIRSKAPYRHNTYDPSQMSEYEWVGDP